jgi:O-antigen/teichoic acid export membrane protein
MAANPAPEGVVMRNTMHLLIAQVLVVPLSLFVNAIIARTIGAIGFGQLYLATTYASFAFLFVEWGQSATLTGDVARERARAGELLGSGLAWRASASLIVAPLLLGVCLLAGYDGGFLAVLALVVLGTALASISLACQDILRGFERTDFSAAAYVGWQLLTALVVAPALLLGGRLYTLLLAQAACAALGAAFMLGSMRRLGVPALRVRRATIRQLLNSGTPFLLFAVVMALQGNVDAVFLSRLGSPDALGWQAVARKLVGLLTYPGSALISALYPTLCRLHAADRSTYNTTAAGALRLTAIAAIPVAVGCGYFPMLGIWIFGRDAYAPAAANLRILALFLLLVYLSMPIGTMLMAAGRQRAWAATQFGCVLISAVLDPLLIPWFQARTGNGGLGVCVATVVSETAMVGAGLWLLPAGVLQRSLLRQLRAIAAAGAVMALLAWLMAGLNPWLAAPLALAAYLGCLATGGLLAPNVQWGSWRAMLGRS